MTRETTKNSILNILLAALVATLFLGGCEEAPSPTSPPPPPKVVKPKPKGEPIPAAEESVEPAPPPYVYNPSGRRDPFQPFTAAVKQPVIERGEPLTPLQKFDVNQLKLIAVIIGKGEPRAMIVAPDGKSYILKRGTKIGKQNGTVVEIVPEAVRVEERYYDFSGDIRTSVKEITLPSRGGA